MYLFPGVYIQFSYCIAVLACSCFQNSYGFIKFQLCSGRTRKCSSGERLTSSALCRKARLGDGVLAVLLPLNAGVKH